MRLNKILFLLLCLLGGSSLCPFRYLVNIEPICALQHCNFILSNYINKAKRGFVTELILDINANQQVREC
jgi:hypothetical protein